MSIRFPKSKRLTPLQNGKSWPIKDWSKIHVLTERRIYRQRKALLFMEGCRRPRNLKRVLTCPSFLLLPELSCCVSVVSEDKDKFTLLLGGRLSRFFEYNEVRNLVTIYKEL